MELTVWTTRFTWPSLWVPSALVWKPGVNRAAFTVTDVSKSLPHAFPAGPAKCPPTRSENVGNIFGTLMRGLGIVGAAVSPSEASILGGQWSLDARYTDGDHQLPAC